MEKKSYIFFFVYIVSCFLCYGIEKASFLTNSYYSSKVQTIESKLLNCKNIKSVEIYDAEVPLFSEPDLFSIYIETANGNKFVFENVPENLNFYRDLTRIKELNGKRYNTKCVNFGIKKTKTGLVLTEVNKVLNMELNNILELLENEEAFMLKINALSDSRKGIFYTEFFVVESN